jgi:hypothetical protein
MIMFTESNNRYRGIPEGCPGLSGEYQCLPQGVTRGVDGGWHQQRQEWEIFLATLIRTDIKLYC